MDTTEQARSTAASILIIDPDPYYAAGLACGLRHAGFASIRAHAFDAALASITLPGLDAALIDLDLRAPYGNGQRIAIACDRIGLPCVLWGAFFSGGPAFWAPSASIVLRKPSPIELVIEALKQAGMRRARRHGG